MGTLTLTEIQQLYTMRIMKFIDKGYVINSHTCGGSYTDAETQVDLRHPMKPNELIRIWMIIGPSTRSIIVKSYEYQGSQAYWLSGGQEISSETFYTVSRNRFYTDDYHEIERIRNLRYERRMRQPHSWSYYSSIRYLELSAIPENLLNKLMDRIHAVRGMKRAKSACISEIYAERYCNRLFYYLIYFDNKGHKQIIRFQ